MSTGSDPNHFNYRHGLCDTREYSSWSAMKNRCRNRHDPDYGGRGITYCDEWEDFETFLTDMGPRPENTSIERIDVNKVYYKENCKWADPSAQNFNRRPVTSHERNTSGIVGLDFQKSRNVWRARFKQKLIYRGPSKEEAIKALENARVNWA